MAHATCHGTIASRPCVSTTTHQSLHPVHRLGQCSTSYASRPWSSVPSSNLVRRGQGQGHGGQAPTRLLCPHGGVTQLRAATFVAPAAARDLWDYPGSCVSPTNIQSFRIFHRLSYGHRNHKTFVVVAYDPDDELCQAAEAEVERLASGLAHAPQVTVCKLDVRDPEVRSFLRSVLGVGSLPCVLLYPEAAPGYVRYKGKSITASALLDGINKLYSRTLPTRPALELRGVPETASTSASTSLDPSAAAASAAGRPAPGSPESRTANKERLRQAILEYRAATTSPWSRFDGYWSPGKVAFWAAIAAASVFAFAWDRWLAAAWDRWALERRMRNRRRGVRYDGEQEFEDFQIMMYDRIASGQQLSEADAEAGKDLEEEQGQGQRQAGQGIWPAGSQVRVLASGGSQPGPRQQQGGPAGPGGALQGMVPSAWRQEPGPGAMQQSQPAGSSSSSSSDGLGL